MTQEILLVILIISTIGTLGIITYFLTSQIRKMKEELKSDKQDVLLEWLKDMKGSVEKNSDVLERQLKDQRETMERQMKSQQETLQKQTKVIWERLENSTNVIQKVQNQLGGLQEFGKDMKDLSNILKSPKLRGGLGEQFLYEILDNFLPKDLYKTQFKFKDGSICDALVITDKGNIPIDSKFPMENFREMINNDTQIERDKYKKLFINDVKKRIDEISKKYILPEEGTTEQAVMYIPSENVYYELIANTPEIEGYAKRRNIVMTSPNTLTYFLKVILVAFQQQELQKHTHEILKALSGIKQEAGKFNEDLGILERHISNSYKSMDNVRSKFGRLFTRIEGIQAIEKREETEQKMLEESTEETIQDNVEL